MKIFKLFTLFGMLFFNVSLTICSFRQSTNKLSFKPTIGSLISRYGIKKEYQHQHQPSVFQEESEFPIVSGHSLWATNKIKPLKQNNNDPLFSRLRFFARVLKVEAIFEIEKPTLYKKRNTENVSLNEAKKNQLLVGLQKLDELIEKQTQDREMQIHAEKLKAQYQQQIEEASVAFYVNRATHSIINLQSAQEESGSSGFSSGESDEESGGEGKDEERKQIIDVKFALWKIKKNSKDSKKRFKDAVSYLESYEIQDVDALNPLKLPYLFTQAFDLKENKDSIADCLHVLLLWGFDINACDDNGNTALHYALYTENQRALDYLIEAGADPDKQNIRGNTPIHHYLLKLADQGDDLLGITENRKEMDCVEKYLKGLKPSFGKKNKDKKTILDILNDLNPHKISPRYKNLDGVLRDYDLNDFGKKRIRVPQFKRVRPRERKNGEEEWLSRVIENKSLITSSERILKNLSLNFQYSNVDIHEAAAKGYFHALQEILKDFENKEKTKLVSSKDKYGLLPLHYAIWAGHREIAKYLSEFSHIKEQRLQVRINLFGQCKYVTAGQLAMMRAQSIDLKKFVQFSNFK